MMMAFFNRLMEYKYLLVFTIIFLLSLFLRLAPILNNNIPFTMDQGRDMLDIRNIVVGHHITLIGPTTSINGVFLGPFWYYFNVPAFVLGGGNPSVLVYWQIVWYQLAGFLLWWVLNRKDKILALITSFLFLFAPALFYSSRYSWNANPAAIFVAFFFITLFASLEKITNTKSLLLGLLSGAILQIEAAFGILFFPFILGVSIYKKSNLKNILITTFAFGMTLLPQLFFELRHQFLMTHVLINELTGKSAILGERLNFGQTIQSHFQNFTDITHGLIEIPNFYAQYLFVFICLFLLYKIFISKNIVARNRTYFLVSLSFILFAFTFYLFYPHPLKGWYLNGLYVPYLIIIALGLSEISHLKYQPFKLTIIPVIAVLLINSIFVQTKLIPKGDLDRSGDRSNLRNELEVIDTVYQKAQGQGFKLFNYIPSVYDYPYQYLVWWYGTNKYGYQPAITSYLENVPEYILNNSSYWNKTKDTESNPLTFLIIEKDEENPDRLKTWKNNFEKLCLIEEKTFYWNSFIELRQNCQK